MEAGYGGRIALPRLQQDGAQGQGEDGDGVQPRQGQAQVRVNQVTRTEVTSPVNKEYEIGTMSTKNLNVLQRICNTCFSPRFTILYA